MRAGAVGGRGYGAHLEDQAERAGIKADPPLSPLIRIIRSSLSTLARFTGLSAQPPPTHTLCLSRQTWPPFISKTPSLAHRGLSTEDAPWELCCLKRKVPGKADVEIRLVGGWSHAARAKRPFSGFCSIRQQLWPSTPPSPPLLISVLLTVGTHPLSFPRLTNSIN